MRITSFLLDKGHPDMPTDPSWDGPNTLILAFFAPVPNLPVVPLERLRTCFPGSYMLGCSTSGEILGSRLEDQSIVVAVLRFTETRLSIARTEVAESGLSEEAGERLARALAGPDLKGVFVLSDGIQINGTKLVTGFNRILPAGVPVTGGLAGDGDRFQTTYTFAAGPGEPLKVASRQVGAVGFSGDAIRISSAHCGGGIPSVWSAR